MSETVQNTTAENPLVSFFTRTNGRGSLDLTDMLTYLYLGLGTIVMFGPVAWLILSSFKSESEVSAFPPRMLPYQPETIEIESFNREGGLVDLSFDDLTTLTALDAATDIEIRVDGITSRVAVVEIPADETVIIRAGEETLYEGSAAGGTLLRITDDEFMLLDAADPDSSMLFTLPFTEADNVTITTATDTVRVFNRVDDGDQQTVVHLPQSDELTVTNGEEFHTNQRRVPEGVTPTVTIDESDNVTYIGMVIGAEQVEVIDVQRIQRSLFDITLAVATNLVVADVDDDIRVRLNDLSLPTLELEFAEAEFLINEGETIVYEPDDDTEIAYQLQINGEAVELEPSSSLEIDTANTYAFIGRTSTITWQPGNDLTIENPVVGSYTMPFDPDFSVRVAQNTGLNLISTEQPTISYDVPLNQRTAIEQVEFSFDNYTEGVESFNFLRYFGNSVFVTTTATLLTLFVNSMAAFALSKYRFPGRNAIFVVIISTLMVPLSVILVPAFLLITSLGWNNNLIGVIIPTIGTPTGVFLLRQYMLTIPDELIESARIDGATEWRIYLQIILPLSGPALAVLAIFSVMWRWNDFLWPKIVLTQSHVFTLQVGLESFQGEFNNQWHLILAMTVLSLLPITLVFAFLQRYITTGIATTGMK